MCNSFRIYTIIIYIQIFFHQKAWSSRKLSNNLRGKLFALKASIVNILITSYQRFGEQSQNWLIKEQLKFRLKPLPLLVMTSSYLVLDVFDCLSGSISSCDAFLNVFQSKGLKPEVICPCASSPEALTVAIRRYAHTHARGMHVSPPEHICTFSRNM